MNADRPAMPADYGIERSATGQLPWSWVTERLESSRNYWICTTRADGRPHATPVWGLWLEDAIVFSTDPSSTKARNLADRPDLVVHLESGDETVIAEGRAERLTPAEMPVDFVAAYEAKYGHHVDPSNPMFGFYRLRPSQVLAWREADFPTSAVRFTSAGPGQDQART